MSSTDQTNNTTSNIPSTSTASTIEKDEVEDLVSQLRQKINKSDWLVHNTSAKWESQNPELAKQWREAVKISQTTNDTTEQ